VQFTQGKVTREIPVQREGDNAYVMYQVAPNAGVARITRTE
jgi:hypothetical protein